MVSVLRCGACHTDGALVGKPSEQRSMAGSSVGIAFTNPLEGKRPGVVFPSNLTPDVQTGIGSWSDEQLATMIRTGLRRHGARAIPVMPYLAYADISEEDALAIAAYLRSLPPVRAALDNDYLPEAMRDGLVVAAAEQAVRQIRR